MGVRRPDLSHLKEPLPGSEMLHPCPPRQNRRALIHGPRSAHDARRTPTQRASLGDPDA